MTTHTDHDALQARIQALEAELSALKALEASRTQILSNVSHELRTPLVTIIGYVEMIARQQLGEVPPAAEKGLKVVLRNALRLSDLIDDLLNLSRLQFEEVEVLQERFPIQGAVESAVEDQRFAFEEKGLTLHVDVADDAGAVEADRRLTRIVLENLLKNALKFTPRGGAVTVAARRRDGRVDVSVRDTGVGIPEEAQQRVFEPFYQLDPSPTRSHGGIGVGLAIVRRIVEAHGGRVSLESRQGEGTTVRFDLPGAGA